MIRSATFAGLTLAVAAAFSGSALAATDAAPATQTKATSAEASRHDGKAGKPGKEGRHHAGKQHRDAAWIPGLGPVPKPVLDGLALNDAQQKQLTEARDAQRTLHQAMREDRKAGRATLDAQLQAGKLDPRALVQARESQRDKFRAQADGVQKQWLALWDSLDATQQGKVAEFVKQRHAEHGKRRAPANQG